MSLDVTVVLYLKHLAFPHPCHLRLNLLHSGKPRDFPIEAPSRHSSLASDGRAVFPNLESSWHALTRSWNQEKAVARG